MSQGRGSASTAMVIAIILPCLLIHTVPSHGATYTVGGPGGWTFNLSNWPKGKSFNAGDVLVFNYDPSYHNVVAVDRGGYSKCTTPASAKVYTTGKDQIRLVRGQNYFICNFSGHCESGMKIAINAV
ncbi:Basic blue protein [Actinidia chinensis var. chinensis]|uniref:Basic blue protein n=1 Tax=Actinidia chinensis var. chinensis TaxID=1590841 RepID=A0A2R6RP04_ACTCC|nr:Basic blue protein [Actinidia chinensis var. chinensis]